MPFRAAFDCLWCGRRHAVRGPTDIEGYAQLCPECVGKAGSNGFLRARLHAALTERAAATRGAPSAGPDAAASPEASSGTEGVAGPASRGRTATDGEPPDA